MDGGLHKEGERVGRVMREERIPILYRILAGLSRVLYRLLFQMTVKGVDCIPARGAAIVVCNHVSFLDPPALGACGTKRLLQFMARDTLMPNAFMRWVFRRLCIVPLARHRGDVGALRQALRILREGGVLVLFPEGTRSLDGELQDAKAGVGFLVANARCPVVPACIEGSFQAWPKGSKWPRMSPITLAFDTPISAEQIASMATGREAYQAIAEFVMARIATLQARVRMEVLAEASVSCEREHLE